jgi:RnfABCDGE-type electron transport complex B subunit
MEPSDVVSSIAASIVILGSLGVAFAAVIAVVTKRFWVWEDPRIDEVTGMLPGNNCGGCGLAGCRAFAEALTTGTTQPAQCTSINAEGASAVALLLGVDVGHATRRVARLLCGGGTGRAVRLAEYRGLETCAAAAADAGGGTACAWACLGLGDSQRSCTFDAIVMNDRALPVVIPNLCTACGDCVEACPKDIFRLMPITQKLIVQCRNLLEGAAADAVCSAACNGCGRCAADAAPGLIAIRNGLAVIDYTKNDLAQPSATRRCPTDAIAWVDDRQFVLASAPGSAERAEPLVCA